jgi:hypothetical protein
MSRVFQKNLNALGINMTLEQSSKLTTLRSSLMKTRLERDPQQTAQCAYSRSYIGETGRPLVVRLHEHRHNLREGLLEKLKLAPHAYEEGRRVGWDEVMILEIESNSRYEKYKESSHMTA